MTDLRARLANALREAGIARSDFESSSLSIDFNPWPTSPRVLLSLDGIAVVERADLNQLLAVAQLYVDAFSEDEMMTLPEKVRLQEIERILVTANAAEEAK